MSRISLPRDVILYEICPYLTPDDLLPVYVSGLSELAPRVREFLSKKTLEELLQLWRKYPHPMLRTSFQLRASCRVEEGYRLALNLDLPNVCRILPPYPVYTLITEAIKRNKYRIIEYHIKIYSLGVIIGCYERDNSLPIDSLLKIIENVPGVRKQIPKRAKKLRALLGEKIAYLLPLVN
jgi:hypothetical protein